MISCDICIVGAGPCGLISALQLSKDFKVCVIEAGRNFEQRICNLDLGLKCKENCNPCNIISGYGGCQFLDGTKACFYPAGSGLLKFKSKEDIRKYYNEIEDLLVDFGKPLREDVDSVLINNIVDDFNLHNIDIKYYNAQKVDKNIMQKIGLNIRKKLDKNNVSFIWGEKVLDIKHENDFKVYTDRKMISAHRVILATGRYGGMFLNRLADKIGIKYESDNLVGEIGVRIEMPSKVFEKINDVFNDIKLKRRIDDANEIRTFCQNYKGIVRKCVFDVNARKLSSLDGCVLGPEDNNTKSVNIAIHHRKSDVKKIDDFNKMIFDSNKNRKPIVQNMKSFLNDTEDCFIDDEYCTMKDYVCGNINKYLPADTLRYIKEMIIDIDEVLPGFANEKNIIYAPSFEFGANKYKLNSNFETNIKGLYIGGDASGYFRGLMQAMISGKIISDDILRSSYDGETN